MNKGMDYTGADIGPCQAAHIQIRMPRDHGCQTRGIEEGTGMHTIGWLSGRVSDREVAKAAFAQGVEVVPLSSFYATRLQRNGLILGFTAFDKRQLHCCGVRPV